MVRRTKILIKCTPLISSRSIPIAAIVAPGSLTVFPQSTNETISLPVRQLDFNYSNFGTFVGGGSTELLGDPRIYNLAFRTASTGETIELDSPGHYQNISYHLDFRGPAVKCASASEEFLYNLTYQYGVKADTMIKYRFLSWTDTLLETPPEDEVIRFPGTRPEDARIYSRVYVMTNEGSWNVTRTYNGTESLRYRQVNVTECLLYNASYSVDFRFEYPSQTRNASVSDWLNPVVSLSNREQRGDNLTVQETLSYAAVMDAFTQMLVGEARKDKYRVEKVTSTIWKLSPIGWKDGAAVVHGLEELFQNITLGLLSDDALM
jgi:hypothetical protein